MEEGVGCTGDAVTIGKADVSGWVGADEAVGFDILRSQVR